LTRGVRHLGDWTREVWLYILIAFVIAWTRHGNAKVLLSFFGTIIHISAAHNYTSTNFPLYFVSCVVKERSNRSLTL